MLADKLAHQTGYPVTANIGYATRGSPVTHSGIERHISTITLELPGQLSHQMRQDNIAALLAFVRWA